MPRIKRDTLEFHTALLCGRLGLKYNPTFNQETRKYEEIGVQIDHAPGYGGYKLVVVGVEPYTTAKYGFPVRALNQRRKASDFLEHLQTAYDTLELAVNENCGVLQGKVKLAKAYSEVYAAVPERLK